MREKVIAYLKKNEQLLYIVAFFYSVFHGSNVWRYMFRKNVKFKGAFLNHTHLDVCKGGSLYIGAKCQMNHCRIDVWGGADLCIRENDMYKKHTVYCT